MNPRPVRVGDVLELRATLRHVQPPIWRSLRVPAGITLDVVHDALQTAFGWKNCHLHEFRVGDIRFGMVDREDTMFTVDERAAPLGAVARGGATLVYHYDFGDDWEHDIAVEHVGDGRDAALQCTGGARACPPEDCGGPLGYAHLLEVLADRKHEEHADLKASVPRGFDPERFDLAAVNRKLATLSKRVARWRQ